MPSKHRFGSALEAAAEQAPGLAVSSLLPRVFQRAFPKWDSPDAHPGDEGQEEIDEHSRKYIKSKVWRAKIASADVHQNLHLLCSSVCLRPEEWLWARLQHLDQEGGLLLDITCGSNPIDHAQLDLCRMLLEPSKRLDMLWYHFAFNPDLVLEAKETVRPRL